VSNSELDAALTGIPQGLEQEKTGKWGVYGERRGRSRITITIRSLGI
jgi:hypothetical protein